MIVYIFQNQINNAKITLKIYVYCTCFTQKITIFYKQKTKKILKKNIFILLIWIWIPAYLHKYFTLLISLLTFFVCLTVCYFYLLVLFSFFFTINKNTYLYWSIYIFYSIPWSYELYFIISNLWFCFDSLNNNSRKKGNIILKASLWFFQF